MSTGVNIKNPRAVGTLRDLAAFYGTNLTQAILRAGEDLLPRSDEEPRRIRAERINATLARCRANRTGTGTFDEAGMYDEIGLPLW